MCVIFSARYEVSFERRLMMAVQRPWISLYKKKERKILIIPDPFV